SIESAGTASVLDFVYVNVLPVIPESTVKIRHSKQKKANGKYSIVGTPNTPVINTPHTLHGTSGFITVPASSDTLDKFFSARPTFLNCGWNVSAVKRIDRYCSPMSMLTPMALRAEPMMTDLTVRNIFSIEANNLGTSPSLNSRPPSPNASKIIPIVENILSNPPRVNNSSICSTPVSDT